MFNKYTVRQWALSILVFLLVVSILRALTTTSEKPRSYLTATIHSTGIIAPSPSSPLSPSSPPSGGVDFITLTTALASLTIVVGWITGLFKSLYKWLWWKTKYGKSRTPIVLPFHLKSNK